MCPMHQPTTTIDIFRQTYPSLTRSVKNIRKYQAFSLSFPLASPPRQVKRSWFHGFKKILYNTDRKYRNPARPTEILPVCKYIMQGIWYRARGSLDKLEYSAYM